MSDFSALSKIGMLTAPYESWQALVPVSSVWITERGSEPKTIDADGIVVAEVRGNKRNIGHLLDGAMDVAENEALLSLGTEARVLEVRRTEPETRFKGKQAGSGHGLNAGTTVQNAMPKRPKRGTKKTIETRQELPLPAAELAPPFSQHTITEEQAKVLFNSVEADALISTPKKARKVLKKIGILDALL